jgi:hypothetical protein
MPKNCPHPPHRLTRLLVRLSRKNERLSEEIGQLRAAVGFYREALLSNGGGLSQDRRNEQR